MNESDFCTFRVGDSVEVIKPDGANRFPVGATLKVWKIGDKPVPGRGHIYFVATEHNLKLQADYAQFNPYNYDSFFADQLRKV